MNRIRRPLPADRRAVVAVEFALTVPLVLLLMLGGFDLAMWIRHAYRLNQVTDQMAEIVSRCPAINDPADIQLFFDEANEIADPLVLDATAGGSFILTGMAVVDGQPLVVWQRREGNPQYASHFGANGQRAITGAFSLTGAEVLIGAEAISPVQPWLFSGFLFQPPATAPLYAQSMFLVRSGSSGQLAVLGTGSAPACTP